MGRGRRRNRKRKLPAETVCDSPPSSTMTTEDRKTDDCSLLLAGLPSQESVSTTWLTRRDDHKELSPVLDRYNHSIHDNDDNDAAILNSYYSLLASHFRWKAPTLIQSHTWPHLLLQKNHQKNNVAFVSATASGKTLVFGLTILIRAHTQRQHGIVLLPTRELAIQVGKNLQQWHTIITSSNDDDKEQHHESDSVTHNNTTTTTTTVLVLHGGGEKTSTHVHAVMEALTTSSNALLISATPGRCLDVLQSIQQQQQDKQIQQLSTLFSTICLDEADRLAMQADLCQQVERVLDIITNTVNTTNNTQQLCLCSATLAANARIKWMEWSQRMKQRRGCVVVQVGHMRSMPSRQVVSTESGNDAETETHQTDKAQTLPNMSQTQKATTSTFSRIPSNLTQVLHVCAEHKKARKLIVTLQKIRSETNNKPGLGIIFFNQIKTLQFAGNLLQKNQIPCLELHSQLHQSKRQGVIQTFASGRIPLLLATDVAARGVHIDHVRTVINYDFPSNLEQYIHRCGRAARSNNNAEPGTVYSFFTRNMAVMACDLVELLRATNQQVDPNLQALADETAHKTKKRRSDNKRPKLEVGAKKDQQDSKNDGAQDDDGAYSDGENSFSLAHIEHPATRIVLKRAGNISDASSDSEDVD